MTRIIIALFLLLALAACKSPEPTPVQVSEWLTKHVYKFTDEEAGVVCWVYNAGGNHGGISCLPLSETRLGE